MHTRQVDFALKMFKQSGIGFLVQKTTTVHVVASELCLTKCKKIYLEIRAKVIFAFRENFLVN